MLYMQLNNLRKGIALGSKKSKLKFSGRSKGKPLISRRAKVSPFKGVSALMNQVKEIEHCTGEDRSLQFLDSFEPRFYLWRVVQRFNARLGLAVRNSGCH